VNAEEVHHSAANHRLGTRFEGHRSTPTGHSADEIETVAMARLSRIVIRLLTWRGGASNSHNYRSKPSARAYAAKCGGPHSMRCGTTSSAFTRACGTGLP
jgi:hypothetical protein